EVPTPRTSRAISPPPAKSPEKGTSGLETRQPAAVKRRLLQRQKNIRAKRLRFLGFRPVAGQETGGGTGRKQQTVERKLEVHRRLAGAFDRGNRLPELYVLYMFILGQSILHGAAAHVARLRQVVA